MKSSIKVLSLALATLVAANTATAADDIYNRAAVGDITVQGGASRIKDCNQAKSKECNPFNR